MEWEFNLFCQCWREEQKMNNEGKHFTRDQGQKDNKEREGQDIWKGQRVKDCAKQRKIKNEVCVKSIKRSP